jgi:hypothetical protein
LPIPDVEIDNITRTEVDQLSRVVDFHERLWPQMDPMLVGLRRTALDEQVERVQIDARMLPLNQEKYGNLLNMFGPPSTVRVVTPEDDIISVQAFVDGGDLSIPSHHLFFGIRDAAPRGDVSERRLLKSLQILRTAPAYLGAWPKPWLLERFGFHGTPTDDGMRRMILGLYRLDSPRDFSLLSFDRHILAEVEPLLRVEEVADAAQMRIHVGDIKNSRFGQWANDLDFQRAWETSTGNVHLMHVMTQQFKVPMSQAKDVAEQLLDASFSCPLGGEYQLLAEAGLERWASTAWFSGKEQARSTYVSPLMSWLRGLDATMTIEDERVVARGLLDIQRSQETEQGGIKLPWFNVFGGGKTKPGNPPAIPSPTGPSPTDPPPQPTPDETEFELLPPPRPR